MYRLKDITCQENRYYFLVETTEKRVFEVPTIWELHTANTKLYKIETLKVSTKFKHLSSDSIVLETEEKISSSLTKYLKKDKIYLQKHIPSLEDEHVKQKNQLRTLLGKTYTDQEWKEYEERQWQIYKKKTGYISQDEIIEIGRTRKRMENEANNDNKEKEYKPRTQSFLADDIPPPKKKKRWIWW